MLAVSRDVFHITSCVVSAGHAPLDFCKLCAAAPQLGWRHKCLIVLVFTILMIFQCSSSPSTETYRYTEDDVLKIKSLWKTLNKVLVLVLTPPPISACTWLIYCSGFLRHNGGHMIKCLWNEVVAVSEATITAGILQSSHACAASLLLLFPINSTSIEIVSAPRCHTTNQKLAKNDLRIEKKQV